MISSYKPRREDRPSCREGRVAMCARNCMAISWKRNITHYVDPWIYRWCRLRRIIAGVKY